MEKEKQRGKAEKEGRSLKHKHLPHNNMFPRQQKGWERKSMTAFQQSKGCFLFPGVLTQISKDLTTTG